MNNETYTYLNKMARKVRQNIAEIGFNNRVHIGPSYSIVEIISYIYCIKLGYPSILSDRDRFILSKGHGAFAIYSLLTELGIISRDYFYNYGGKGNSLTIHPNIHIPTVEVGTGSLGHGLAIGAGIALSQKIKQDKAKTIVLMGDGEQAEGSVWESVMFANHYKLDNLIAIIDLNGLQQSDKTETIMNTTPLADKYLSFGWNVIEADGHDFYEIEKAFNKVQQSKPTVIIAHTIKGKGISFMENNKDWHMNVINEKLKKQVLSELKM